MSTQSIRNLCLLLAATCFGAALRGPVPASAATQVDTLVFRRDTISISRGLLYPGADTVAISLMLDSLDMPKDPAPEVLTPLATGREQVRPIAPLPTAKTFLAAGDSLHLRYDFAEALAQYRAAAQLPDAEPLLLSSRMAQSQNGLNLSESVAFPTVIARQRFSLKDFYLFYPLRANSWRAAPNVLDRGGHPLVGATYVPRDEKRLIFSAPDADGYYHLYYTEDRDTAWSHPALLDEKLLSGGQEIYPVLSPDGQRLYFASDALYGVGGYDLYMSERDPESGAWKEPVNLGFPYSSPADDFLLMDTPDGKYTLFASNRACSRDSVYVYVIEQQKNPRKRAEHDAAALRTVCALSPDVAATRIDAGSAIASVMPDNDATRRFQDCSDRVSRLRDSVAVQERALLILREELASGVSGGGISAETITGMASAIARQEESLGAARTSLEAAQEELRSAEQAFLESGVQSRTQRTADREVVGASSAYVFAKRSTGAHLKMRIAPAPPAGEESFRIAPVGRFAQPGSLPAGVVFQISLFSSPRHATLEDLGGLSPVYERLTPNLRYAYSVGIFPTYEAALERLGAVRRLGFPDAAVIAFRDGLPVPVTDARRAQGK